MSDTPAAPRVSQLDELSRLLAAARAGSVGALGVVLEGCRQYLLLVANEELGSDLQPKAGPSDLVQDTFLEAHRDFAHFHGDTERELLAWLRRLLLNNLANFQRQYRHTAQRQIGREVSLDALDSLRGILIDSSSPSAQAVRNEEAEVLERALQRLPEHYRQAIVLRHRESRTFDEIGRLMDRSPDAARMLWWRAFERLAQELGLAQE